MSNEEQLSGSGPDQEIEEGKTFTHANHGRVQVTGIWRRTQRLQMVDNTARHAMIVVRFVPGEDGEWSDELAESLDDFLNAID